MKIKIIISLLLVINPLLAMQPDQVLKNAPAEKNSMDLGPFASNAFSNAIEREDIATLESLLTAGANPNLRLPALTSLGKTQTDELPLTRATSKGNIAIIRLLIKAGADQSLKNKGGETALDMARRSAENLAAIRHMFDPNDNTPSAAELNQKEIIHLLENPELAQVNKKIL